MSDEPDQADDDLFRQAMTGVERLEDARAEPYRRRGRPELLHLRVGDEDSAQLADTEIETPDELRFMRPGIQRRLFEDLRRGLLPPEGNLDLHGMRVHDARSAIVRFLEQSLRQRRRCVRIVHGKGFRSAERQPVLKAKVNAWLRQLEPVLAFCSAPRWDGGIGATYVLLSRKAGTLR